MIWKGKAGNHRGIRAALRDVGQGDKGLKTAPGVFTCLRRLFLRDAFSLPNLPTARLARSHDYGRVSCKRSLPGLKLCHVCCHMCLMMYSTPLCLTAVHQASPMHVYFSLAKAQDNGFSDNDFFLENQPAGHRAGYARLS